jgi:hypothetical protein
MEESCRPFSTLAQVDEQLAKFIHGSTRTVSYQVSWELVVEGKQLLAANGGRSPKMALIWSNIRSYSANTSLENS